MGARIEIVVCFYSVINAVVAPLVGARIEMEEYCNLRKL